MSFNTLGLSAELLRAIEKQGYREPTPVQEQSIPVVLSGRDVLVRAQTGTGKTAAYALPLLQRLSKNSNKESNAKRRVVRALILAPTRELAQQVQDCIRAYAEYLSLFSAPVYGGVSINPQISQLRRGVDIVVATPGRLLDHVEQRTVDLSQVEILVLDEADRMLDMGFIRDIRRIIKCLPKQRQNLLLSATISAEIKELVKSLAMTPVLIELAPQAITADGVTQVVHPVKRERKRELLSFIIGSNNWQRVLVFTRTKHGANRLAEQLARDGLTATAIHGNKTQAARSKALAAFKKGVFRVLVATDVAARGLDIDALPYVINFDLPNVPEDYVHRIGRTARAGQSGSAISLVSKDEQQFLKGIERLLKIQIPKVAVDGY